MITEQQILKLEHSQKIELAQALNNLTLRNCLTESLCVLNERMYSLANTDDSKLAQDYRRLRQQRDEILELMRLTDELLTELTTNRE